MAARQESHQDLVDDRFLSNDPLTHFRAQARGSRKKILA
jgi:hypothetical protein